MEKKANPSEYEALKKKVLALGYVRPGSLLKRFMPCGKAGCRCMADPPELHGPYYQWTYKRLGKTITVRLNPAQAELCREWVRDHRDLRRIVSKMRRLSLRETDKLLRAKSES